MNCSENNIEDFGDAVEEPSLIWQSIVSKCWDSLLSMLSFGN